MIVVVTGGRNYNDRAAIYAALDQLHAQYPITRLREGDASGVDRISGEWADMRGIQHDKMPADWSNINVPGAVVRQGKHGAYNARAGHDRNQSMLDADPKPQYGIVFPGGTGTADMTKRMRESGITVWEPYKCA